MTKLKNEEGEMKFRKKPVVIEAVQLTNEVATDCLINNRSFFGDLRVYGHWHRETNKIYSAYINISTLEGVMRADLNDWIIKGIKGEFYPCKPDIFEATYERVEE